MEQLKNFNGLSKFFFKRYLKLPKLPLIEILHTFGKDLKFNPHLHLITASSISFKHKFNRLWKHEVLKQLNIPRTNNYSYGFYVWNSGAINKGILSKYIARYVRHPAITNTRIIKYNKENVTFFYKDNNKNKIIVKKPVLGFINSLIQHIPPEQFKMIRYYGAYSRNHKRKYYNFLTSSVE